MGVPVAVQTVRAERSNASKVACTWHAHVRTHATCNVPSTRKRQLAGPHCSLERAPNILSCMVVVACACTGARYFVGR
eukprot:2314270-Pyramimonas_sp.AAC.1